MRTVLQRLVAGLAAALLIGSGVAFASSWSPTTLGLVTAASAGDDDNGGDDDDDDDDGGDDDGGQVPAGGVQTGLGGAAGDDDDGDGDDDGGQVPAGGVQTGFGGAAESWTTDPVSNERSGGGDAASTLVPVAALGLGGLAVGRLVATGLSRSRMVP